jgi:hypothetical protein
MATANVISVCLSLPAGVVKREAEAEPKKKGGGIGHVISDVVGDLGGGAIDTIGDGAIDAIGKLFG